MPLMSKPAVGYPLAGFSYSDYLQIQPEVIIRRINYDIRESGAVKSRNSLSDFRRFSCFISQKAKTRIRRRPDSCQEP